MKEIGSVCVWCGNCSGSLASYVSWANKHHSMGAGKRLWAHTLPCGFEVREGNQDRESEMEAIYATLGLCVTNHWSGFLFFSLGVLYQVKGTRSRRKLNVLCPACLHSDDMLHHAN